MVTITHAETTLVQTSSLFDPTTLKFLPNHDFIIDHSTGLIVSIHQRSSATSRNQSEHTHTLDLRGKNVTVLPGLTDAHTHLFLHPYTEASNNHQRTNESLLERTIRATVHVRHTLDAGFTTVRDLGTESAGDADIALRNSIEKGIIPGPRVLAATQAVVSSGTYEPPNPNAEGGLRVPAGGDVADGIEGCRAAVRRRLGVGIPSRGQNINRWNY